MRGIETRHIPVIQRILLVDDDAAVLKTVRELLELHGYVVDPSGSPVTAPRQAEMLQTLSWERCASSRMQYGKEILNVQQSCSGTFMMSGLSRTKTKRPQAPFLRKGNLNYQEDRNMKILIVELLEEISNFGLLKPCRTS